MVLDTVWTAGTIPAALKPPTGPSDTTNTRNNPIGATLVIWHAAVAGSVSIQDINGNIIAEQTVPAASPQIGQDVVIYSNSRNPLKLKMGGWVLATLTGGQLVIYY
jgi:hypothetical protein